MNDQGTERGAADQPESLPDAGNRDTTGTGSALAVGCIAVVVLLVIIALAVRWIGNAW